MRIENQFKREYIPESNTFIESEDPTSLLDLAWDEEDCGDIDEYEQQIMKDRFIKKER